MRPFADQAQNVRPSVIRAMNPRTETGLTVQRAVLRAAVPVANTFSRLTGALTRPPSNAIDLPDYPVPAGRTSSL